MNKEDLRGKIYEICDPADYQNGFADMTGLLKEKYRKYNYGISLLRRLDNQIINQLSNGPTKEYYQHYDEINQELDSNVQKIEAVLKEKGIDALAITATRTEYELDNDGEQLLCSEVSHKMLATRSGLGWIGKTGLLISKKYGPRVRLSSILIDYPVEADCQAVETSQCGNCNRCVQACPVSASNGLLWYKGMEREEFLDVYKCREACLQLSRTRIGKEISICGICISVCPYGK